MLLFVEDLTDTLQVSVSVEAELSTTATSFCIAGAGTVTGGAEAAPVGASFGLLVESWLVDSTSAVTSFLLAWLPFFCSSSSSLSVG